MIIRKGYDPNSLGLIKYDYNNTDERYQAVKSEGGLIHYALHPKYFNRENTLELENHFKSERPQFDFSIDTKVYVGDVNVKGYKTHSDFLTDSVERCPIFCINNPFSKLKPYDYARQLQDGTATRYALHELNYGTTFNEFTLDIRELPNIDLNADTNISISIGDISITRPLQHLLDPENPEPILEAVPVGQMANGFTYRVKFANQHFNSQYTKTYRQSCIVDGYTQFMLQNGNRDRDFSNSPLYQTAMSVIGDASNFNILGGVGSALDGFLEHGLRDARNADLSNQTYQVGGDIIADADRITVDTLIKITYPIQKKLGSIIPSLFEINKPRTFTINKLFDDANEAINYIETNYKGTIVSGDIEPFVDYGNYTEYFKRIISLGGLE